MSVLRSSGVSRLLLLCLVLLGLYFYRSLWLPRATLPAYLDGTSGDNGKGKTSERRQNTCRDVPGANTTMILLKTGATELYQKLPAHFVTTFTCIPHFMILSDLAQDFADYPVHDALENVSEKFRNDHSDFELYRKLRQYQKEGQDMGELKDAGSWDLDKWKFLPMIHKAFAEAPEWIEWFVVMEADTSVSWTNLLQWLRTMDTAQPFYVGSQNYIGQTLFAHGGSGIVLSRKTLELLENLRQTRGVQNFDEEWENVTAVSCCGDEIIARTFRYIDVELTPAWPLMQGETVATLDWTVKHWCSVVVTWHHVSAIEIDLLWQFESDWIEQHGWNVPYLYRDVFERFIAKHIAVNRTGWDNLSQDRKLVSPQLADEDDIPFAELSELEQQATGSQNTCAEVCARMQADECLQWMYSPGRCYLGKDIRFGKSDERQDNAWTSGWLQERLEAFKERQKGCEVKWEGER